MTGHQGGERAGNVVPQFKWERLIQRRRRQAEAIGHALTQPGEATEAGRLATHEPNVKGPWITEPEHVHAEPPLMPPPHEDGLPPCVLRCSTGTHRARPR